MTELQAMIKNALAKNGGIATFDTIYKYVSKRWSALKHKPDSGYPTTADCRTEVSAALVGGPSPACLEAEGNSKASVVYIVNIFQKAPSDSSSSEGEEGEGNDDDDDYQQVKWIAIPVIETAAKDEKLESEEKASDEENLNETESKLIVESASGESSTVSSPDVEMSDSKSADKTESLVSSKLTDMQGMLMKVILSYGGVANFEQIFDSVMKKQLWKSKKVGDSKRALLASLSHNPPGNFRKTKDGQWTIAPKALSIAEELTKEDSTLSLIKMKSL